MYRGLNKKTENSLIQKSRPLLSLTKTEMPLTALKILDVYLARIDSHNDEKRTVTFSKGELEKLFGVDYINPNELEKRLENLFRSVTIEEKNKFHKISLFEIATAEQDENGLWTVILKCTESAKKYIFNIDQIGYLRYRLKNIKDLTSRYSYCMFLYLEDNRFRKSWVVEVDELKEILRCKEETYEEFKHFNNLVLKKIKQELTEKTEVRYSYEPIRVGRKVGKIQFTLETIADYNLSLEAENHNYDDEFNSIEQLQELEDLLSSVFEEKRKDLLDSVYNSFYKLAANRENTEKPIKNRFGYFKSMLLKEIGE